MPDGRNWCLIALDVELRLVLDVMLARLRLTLKVSWAGSHSGATTVSTQGRCELATYCCGS